jgi:hypothetical protein
MVTSLSSALAPQNCGARAWLIFLIIAGKDSERSTFNAQHPTFKRRRAFVGHWEFGVGRFLSPIPAGWQTLAGG